MFNPFTWYLAGGPPDLTPEELDAMDTAKEAQELQYQVCNPLETSQCEFLNSRLGERHAPVSF